MGLGTVATEALKTSAQAIRAKLAQAGMAGAGAAAAKKLSPATEAILHTAVPNAIATTGLNLLGGAGVGPSLVAGIADLGFTAGGMRLAGKFAPGIKGNLSYLDPTTKKVITQEHFLPSFPQQIVQGISPVVSSMAIMPLLQNQQIEQAVAEPMVMDQTATSQQQLMQRNYINQLQQEATSPGTMFQLQGIESTLERAGSIPEYVDPYGILRGGMM